MDKSELRWVEDLIRGLSDGIKQEIREELYTPEIVRRLGLIRRDGSVSGGSLAGDKG